MDKERNGVPGHEEPPVPEVKPLKERLYDKIPISLRTLDIIIALLAVAIVACVVIGALKGNGTL